MFIKCFCINTMSIIIIWMLDHILGSTQWVQLTIIAHVSDAHFFNNKKRIFGCHQHRLRDFLGVVKVKGVQIFSIDKLWIEWHMFMQNIVPEIDLLLRIMIRNYHKFKIFINYSETMAKITALIEFVT
jgi:hypothetical protein